MASSRSMKMVGCLTNSWRIAGLAFSFPLSRSSMFHPSSQQMLRITSSNITSFHSKLIFSKYLPMWTLRIEMWIEMSICEPCELRCELIRIPDFSALELRASTSGLGLPASAVWSGAEALGATHPGQLHHRRGCWGCKLREQELNVVKAEDVS